MPVSAATRFERYVGNRNLLRGNHREITVADEIAGISRIRFANRENHLPLKGRLGIRPLPVLGPNVLGQTEGRPGFRPTGIKTEMGNDFGYVGTGNAVVFGRLQMIYQRIVRNALTDERRKRHQTAVPQAEFVGAAPYLAEKDLVVQLRELRGERAQLVAAGRLYNLLLCHNVKG